MNGAILLDNTKREWVDMEILHETCIAFPDTCGAAGGSFSFCTRISIGVLSFHHVQEAVHSHVSRLVRVLRN